MKYINNIPEFPETVETSDETEAIYEKRSGDKAMGVIIPVLAIVFYIIGFMSI